MVSQFYIDQLTLDWFTKKEIFFSENPLLVCDKGGGKGKFFGKNKKGSILHNCRYMYKKAYIRYGWSQSNPPLNVMFNSSQHTKQGKIINRSINKQSECMIMQAFGYMELAFLECNLKYNLKCNPSMLLRLARNIIWNILQWLIFVFMLSYSLCYSW